MIGAYGAFADANKVANDAGGLNIYLEAGARDECGRLSPNISVAVDTKRQRYP